MLTTKVKTGAVVAQVQVLNMTTTKSTITITNDKEEHRETSIAVRMNMSCKKVILYLNIRVLLTF